MEHKIPGRVRYNCRVCGYICYPDAGDPNDTLPTRRGMMPSQVVGSARGTIPTGNSKSMKRSDSNIMI